MPDGGRKMDGEFEILIVDDDPNIVKCLSLVLSAEGYAVESACDGDEGLEEIQRNKPDLIILDEFRHLAVALDRGADLFRTGRNHERNARLLDAGLLGLANVVGAGETQQRNDRGGGDPRGQRRNLFHAARRIARSSRTTA